METSTLALPWSTFASLPLTMDIEYKFHLREEHKMSNDKQDTLSIGQCRSFMLWSQSLVYYGSKKIANERGLKLYTKAKEMIAPAFRDGEKKLQYKIFF